MTPTRQPVVTCEYCGTQHENTTVPTTAKRPSTAHLPSMDYSYSKARMIGLPLLLTGLASVASMAVSQLGAKYVVKDRASFQPDYKQKSHFGNKMNSDVVKSNYIAECSHNDGREGVCALNVKEGKWQWRYFFNKGTSVDKLHVGSEFVVVVSDHAELIYFSSATGEELSRRTLDEKADRLCMDGANGFVELSNDERFTFSKEGELTKVKKTSICPKHKRFSERGASGFCKTYTSHSPIKEKKLPIRFSWAHISGDNAVISGTRKKGTSVPELVGVSLKEKSIRWHGPLATENWTDVSTYSGDRHDALFEDKYVAVYKLKNGRWKVVMRNALDGKLLWEKLMPEESKCERVHITEEDVIVVGWTKVFVFAVDGSGFRLHQL